MANSLQNLTVTGVTNGPGYCVKYHAPFVYRSGSLQLPPATAIPVSSTSAANPADAMLLALESAFAEASARRDAAAADYKKVEDAVLAITRVMSSGALETRSEYRAAASASFGAAEPQGNAAN